MHGSRRHQRGAFVIFTAVAIVVLLGFVGLAVDLSRAIVVKVELQNAADACALAAVIELNSYADAPARATQAGRFVGGVRNQKSFQAVAADIAASDITFATTRDSANYLPASGFSPGDADLPNLRFVKCRATHGGLANYFLGVVGVGQSGALDATAIATVQASQTACALPMGMCAGPTLTAGSVLQLGGTSQQGFFTWANVLGTDVPGQAELLDAFSAHGSCDAATAAGRPIGTYVGAIQRVEEGWNTRFGLYKSPTRPADNALIESPPDLTGYGFGSTVTSSVLPTYSQQALLNSMFQSNLGSYFKSTSILQDFGRSFRRVAPIPVLDCTNANAAQKVIRSWACVIMLSPAAAKTNNFYVQYIGEADDPASPCRSPGIAGESGGEGPLTPVLVL